MRTAERALAMPQPGAATQSGGGGRRSLVAALLCVSLAFGTVLASLVVEVERLALTLVMIGAAVGYLTQRRAEGPWDYFEVFVPFSAQYIVGFGLSSIALAYYPELVFRRSLLDYLTPALLLGTIGYLSFLAGYALMPGVVKPTWVSHLRIRSPLAVLLPGAVGFAGFLARIAIERRAQGGATITAGLSALSHFAPLFFFAWFLAWAMFFSVRERRYTWCLVTLIPAVAVILTLTVGSKLLAITMFGVPMVAYWYDRRRLPIWTLFALFAIAVFAIFPIYNTYRFTNRQLSVGRRIDTTFTSVRSWDRDDFIDRSALAFLGRVATITSTAAVVRDVGRWVDYKYGETLFLAPVSILIPRFIWPDKPNITIGREFGLTFKLVGATDRETQVASSWVGELYWNFHVPGVVIGMLAIGMVYRWLQRKLGIGGGDENVRQGFYLTMLTVMLQAEGDLAANLAGIVKLALIMIASLAALRSIGALSNASESTGG